MDTEHNFFGKLMRLAALIYVLALVTIPCVSAANIQCKNLFTRVTELRYAASASEVAKLYESFPEYRKLVLETLETIRINEPATTKPAFTLEDMVFYESASNLREIEKNISPEVKKDILAVYNVLHNKFMLIKYTKQLLEDVGVLMMKEADLLVLKRTDMHNAQSDFTSQKITKRHYLEIGQADHNSLRRVLTNRVLARGDQMSIILSKEHGSYDKNKTRNYRHDDFFDVLRRGPFFDLEFRKGQAHGQDAHLLQMDFVEQVLTFPLKTEVFANSD